MPNRNENNSSNRGKGAESPSSWRSWYNHGVLPSYMREVGTYSLLSQEEEAAWAKQYREARQQIMDLLQAHPLVIVKKLKELRDNPDRKALATYLVFSRSTGDNLEAEGESEEDGALEEVDSEVLNTILENSVSFIRDCTRRKKEPPKADVERSGGATNTIAEIIAPYLKNTGKVQFQQRFFTDCVECFVSGDWEEEGLSQKEKARLCQEMREINDREHQAMNALVEGNLRLVISVAKHFSNSLLSLPDLIQEGNIGLIRAVETFDWQRGHRLSTFACYRIRQAISQALNSMGRPIRIPVNILRMLRKISRCEQQFIQQNDAEPTEFQLAELVGISVPRLRALRRMEQQPISLQSMSTEDRDWNDLLADCSENVSDHVNREGIRESLQVALASLKPNERDVISRRFGLNGEAPQSLDTIAKSYGLTRERIRQIEVSALMKLRRNYGGQLT